ncbi:hypothetical protein ACIQU5_31980 [Streptomyces sp. NPDC090306]|uniref:hypothetical protein n=1 Tax=Streptomyces sp. NPDC090306 TaxID=3365961 RepID=UPI0038132E3A
MPWTSAVPATIDALVERLGTSPEFEGVMVWDGPQVTKAGPRTVLTVGWTGDDTNADVELTAAREGLAAGRDRESFTIRCAAAVLTGDTKIAAARRRAYELYAGAGAVLARDPRLGGAVLNARIGSHTLTQDQTPSGAQAVIVFGVDCDAYTR